MKQVIDPFTAVRGKLEDWLFADPDLAVEVEKFNRLTEAEERRRGSRRTLTGSNPSVKIAHVFGQHQPFQTSTSHASLLRYDVRLRVGSLEDESVASRLQWLIFRRMCTLRAIGQLGLPFVHRVMLESHEQSPELVEQQNGWLSVIVVQVSCHFSDQAIGQLSGVATP